MSHLPRNFRPGESPGEFCRAGFTGLFDDRLAIDLSAGVTGPTYLTDLIMDTIEIPCPQCGIALKLRDRSLLGRKGKCPKCAYVFVLEEPEMVQLELDEPGRSGPDFAQQPIAAFKSPAESEGAITRLKGLKKPNVRQRQIGLVVGAVGLVAVGSAVYFAMTNAAPSKPGEIQIVDAENRVDDDALTAPRQPTPTANTPQPVAPSKVEPIELHKLQDLAESAVQKAKQDEDAGRAGRVAPSKGEPIELHKLQDFAESAVQKAKQDEDAGRAGRVEWTTISHHVDVKKTDSLSTPFFGRISVKVRSDSGKESWRTFWYTYEESRWKAQYVAISKEGYVNKDHELTEARNTTSSSPYNASNFPGHAWYEHFTIQ